MYRASFFTAAFLTSIIAPIAATADPSPVWLTNAEIEAALSGKTIDGRYASGRSFSERYASDGRVEYKEAGATIGGHWSVTSGTLCTIYDNDPAGGCFRVSRVSENCFEFFFAARTEEAARAPNGGAPLWTARGAVNGEASACHDAESV